MKYVEYELNQFILDTDGKLKYPNFPYVNKEKTELLPNWCDTKQKWNFDFNNQEMRFHQMPLEFQETYKSQIIPTMMILGCTKGQAHIIFNLINVGVAQNPQEFRSALDIPIAGIVRNLADEFKEFYKKHIFTPKSIKRKVIDENIVWKGDWYTRRAEITDERIDGYKKHEFFQYSQEDFMYKENCKHLEYMQDTEKSGKITKSIFHKILTQNVKSYENFPKKIKNWGWRQDFTWFQILSTLYDNYKISDLPKAFEIFYEQEIARRTDTDTIVYKHDGGTKTYSGCTSKTNANLVKLTLEIALGDFVNNEEVQKLLSPKTSSIRTQPTVKDKVIAFKQQGGKPGDKHKPAKNPVDDAPIHLIDVLNTNTYELDHLIALDLGGSDTSENKFLITTIHHKLKTKLERQGIVFKNVEDYKKLISETSSLQLAA